MDINRFQVLVKNKLMRALCIFLICFSSAYAQEGDPTAFCLQQLNEIPALDILKKKVSLVTAQNQTLEMLNNSSKPNKTEKEAISRWDSEITDCFNQGKVYRKRFYSQKQIAILEAAFLDTKNTISDLYGGQMTYGAFAKTRATLSAKYITAMTDANQEAINQARDIQRQQDSANRESALMEQQAQLQRQANALNAMRYLQNQNIATQQSNNAISQNTINNMRQNTPVIPQYQPLPAQPPLPMPRQPVQTNCYQSGNSVNCTSQ